MNQRNRLMNKAHIAFDETRITEREVTRFMYLIVCECIGIIDEAVEQREPASTYSSKLREYFGIDEVEKQIQQRSSYYGQDV